MSTDKYTPTTEAVIRAEERERCAKVAEAIAQSQYDKGKAEGREDRISAAFGANQVLEAIHALPTTEGNTQ